MWKELKKINTCHKSKQRQLLCVQSSNWLFQRMCLWLSVLCANALDLTGQWSRFQHSQSVFATLISNRQMETYHVSSFCGFRENQTIQNAPNCKDQKDKKFPIATKQHAFRQREASCKVGAKQMHKMMHSMTSSCFKEKTQDLHQRRLFPCRTQEWWTATGWRLSLARLVPWDWMFDLQHSMLPQYAYS